MTNSRTIVVKTLLNADEFLAFDNACKSADEKHSKVLRDLAKGWIDRQHDRRRPVSGEWPGAVHNKAMLLPGRAYYGAGPKMHMRM